MTSRWRTPERDAVLVQIIGSGLVALGVGWPIALWAGWPLWIAVPLLVPVLGTIMYLVRSALMATAGAVVLRATGAHGGGAAPGAQFGMSAVDALVARGRIDEAIERLRVEQFAFEGQPAAEIAQRLAELLLRRDRPEEAAQAFRRARRCWESVRSVEGRTGGTYATRRLLDLYEGPLANAAAADRERDRLRSAS